MTQSVKPKAERSLREIATRFFANLYQRTANLVAYESGGADDVQRRTSEAFHVAVARNEPRALQAFDHFDVAASTISQARVGNRHAIDAVNGYRATRVIRNRPRLKALLVGGAS